MAQKKTKSSRRKVTDVNVIPPATEENGVSSLAVPRVIAGSSLVRHRPLLSPNGAWVLCACGSGVRIYSSESGELLSVLQDSSSLSSSSVLVGLAFNPVSPHSQVWSVDAAGRLVLWAYDTGVPVKRLDVGREVLGLYAPYRDRGIYLLLRATERPTGVETVNGEQAEEVDTSCTLFHIPSLDNLSRKKGQLSVMRGLSEDSHKIAFDPQGDFFAAVNGKSLCLHFLKDQQYKRHLIKDRIFTCVAIHPKERCIATGDSQGRIFLWRCFEDTKQVTKSTLHWHSSAVLDLAFSAEGSYLWSGGHESTLVQWSLNHTDHKDFLPRMGAAIVHLALSYDNNTILVSHADSVVTLVGLQRNILCRIASLYWSSTPDDRVLCDQQQRALAVLAADPIGRALVMRGKPGQLQLYNAAEGKLTPPIDVVGQNIMSSGLSNFINATIDAAAFGTVTAGERTWMCTCDSLITPHVGSVINLKFWEFDEVTKRYVVRMTVVDPHDADPVRSIVFSPHSDDGAVATISESGFKIWMAIREKSLTGSRLIWICTGQGRFKESPPSTCVFSPDGATLAVAFSSLVTFWDVETAHLKDFVLTNPPSAGPIRNLAYGPDGTDTFVTTTDSAVCFWDLSTTTLMSNHTMPGSFATTDPTKAFLAVCGKNSVAVLDTFRGHILYHYIFPTPADIVACLLVANDEPSSNSELPIEWFHLNGLFLLSGKGELWKVDDKSASAVIGGNKLSAGEDERQTTLVHHNATTVTDGKALESLRNGFRHEKKDTYITKLMTVAAYTLPKPEYFLAQHIDSLLGSDNPSEVSSSDVMDVDIEVEPATRPVDAASDDEDMPETKREPAVNESDLTLADLQQDSPEQTFDFLTSAVKSFPKSSSSSSSNRRARTDRKIAYVNASQLYQKIRADSTAS
ncbi:WD repeat-containing protein 75 [Hypsibius exemplaris]|uniref:WD repeat-containing protein 75 n=1 Tax=Hypsibius exemplaris TaxID=2072580 RepID=A0A1W0X7C9_HYPEX|nr:WD repeat-containing protein 75 [Hypsibius exemplaris]